MALLYQGLFQSTNLSYCKEQLSVGLKIKLFALAEAIKVISQLLTISHNINWLIILYQSITSSVPGSLLAFSVLHESASLITRITWFKYILHLFF